MTIYNFGSINIDHIYRVPHLVRPGETLASTTYNVVLGGKGANQSIALAQASADVTHLGRYNAADVWVKQTLSDAGVICDLLQTVDTPTGHAIIQVDDNAENSIVLFSGANTSFSEQDISPLLEPAQAGDWLLFQNECCQLPTLIKAAVEKGLRLVCNPAPMNSNIKELPLHHLDTLIVNEVEAAELFCILVEEITATADTHTAPDSLESGVQSLCPTTRIIITLGSKGVFARDDTGWSYTAAHNVKAVDTTAAGDTFTGFYLMALSRGDSMQDAIKLGCAASALCVQKAGATSSIPSLKEAQDYVL